MFQHIVMLHVAEGTPIDKLTEACQRLEGFVGNIPGLVSLKAGLDLGIEGNLDFGLVAELKDRKALEVFLTHEAHLEVAYAILQFRKPEDLAILDLEV